MRCVTVLLGVLLAMLAVAGCQSSHHAVGHHDDSACQKDLARLMSDQPGYTPPIHCDPTFVMRLEAVR